MDKYVVKKPKKPEPPAVTEITLTEDEKVFREKKNDQAKEDWDEMSLKPSKTAPKKSKKTAKAPKAKDYHAPTPEEHQRFFKTECSVCDTPTELGCSACKSVYFCSNSCQSINPCCHL